MVSWRAIGRKPFFNWGWIITTWSIIAIISASTLFVKLQAGGESPNWWTLFAIKLVIWMFWGVLTPFIFYTGKRFRIDRQSKFIGLLYHIPASLILVGLNIFLYAVIVELVNNSTVDQESLFQIFAALVINQFEWYFIIYWGIVTAGYAFEYYQKIKQKELESVQMETRLMKAQLQALKMQLHPHFLFNTLNTISAQVRLGEKKAAVTMLAGLSDLLRRALQQREKQILPLNEEITFIRQYLDIEATRFKDSLDLQIVVEPNLTQLEIPAFLLQPLVENAIYHGLTKQIDARKLKLHVGRKEDKLVIKIYNDGPKLTEEFNPALSTGIGLSSTIERLHQLYGESHRLELRNVLNGVEVMIEIPIK